MIDVANNYIEIYHLKNTKMGADPAT